MCVPGGGEGVERPCEAMLQLALLPSIIGLGSTQACRADSGSRNVTCHQMYAHMYKTMGIFISKL